MKSNTNPFARTGVLLLLPAVCLTGYLVGSWGAKDELRSYRESVKESRKKSSGKAAGFGTFAKMIKIPETSRRARKSARTPKKESSSATNAVASASRKTPAENLPAAAPAPGSGRGPRRRFSSDDLRVRIEEAQDLWRTRVDVSRARWKDMLKLAGEAEAAFDAALEEMNERLYDSVAAVAELISGAETMTPELGLRLVGETTAIMAETYDRIGKCVPSEMRDDVSSMQIVDFVDPGVAEPLIGVQGKLEAFGEGGFR